MSHSACIIVLLFLLFQQPTDSQRHRIKSVYADTISGQGIEENQTQAGNGRNWGNIFANRRKGGNDEREDTKTEGEAEGGENGRGKGSSTKNTVSASKGIGKGYNHSTKGERSPSSPSRGKGKAGERGLSTLPSASPSRQNTFEPSISPKQIEIDPPTDSPEARRCDVDFLDGFGLRDADCSDSAYDRIRAIPDLSITVALIELLNMTSLLQCAVGLTFLLPTNAAWEQIDNDIIGELLSSREILRNLFLYHILPEMALSSILEEGFRLTLFSDREVLVGVNPLVFDDSLVTVADQLACDRGQVFHIVGQVLLPLLRSEYYFAIDDLLTCFVRNEDPTQMPTSTPTSLIVATERPTVSPTQDCSGFDFGGATGTCKPNLLDTAKQDLTLSLIVSLFEISGLEYIFDCPGPISAALPTNDALIALGRDVLDNLISSDPAALRELLLYHLFPGVFTSTSLSSGLASTLSGSQTVVVEVDPVSFGGVEALSLDNPHCNGGVYHKIGAVLDSAYVAPTQLPSFSPSMTPTTGLRIEVKTGPFFMSFVSDIGTEPTANEFELVRGSIEEYYFERSKEELGISHPNANILNLSLDLAFTLHGVDAGFPRRRFNIYMEFTDATFLFTVANPGLLPSETDLYNILRDGVTRRFLIDVIRVYRETPFAEVVEAAIRPL